MTMDALHPDHLEPGDMVGPWRIVQVLGRGGSSRVFKVERNGFPYSMKIALCPLSDSPRELPEAEHVKEASAYRRLAREAATLFTYASHPNLLRVYVVDYWPNPSRGYPFLVMDFVEGDTWHEWRWREPPHAAGLVDTFSDVVRTVGMLHARGVYHRDLKAENLLIRREDGRPFLIDFGTVRLPGALTQTLGVPDGTLHLLPPEFIAYTRTEAWKRNEPFQGGLAADLYALGALLYQGLTDLHPFDPALPDTELVTAIATVPPIAPHLLNPLVPRSLGAIAMKLLEKRPEDRYPNTEALLQALEKAAENERKTPAWMVPLTPPRIPVDVGREEAPEAVPEVEEARPPENAPSRDGAPRAEAPPRARGRWWGRWLFASLAVLLLLGAMGLLFGRDLLAPSPAAEHGVSDAVPRGIPPMPHSTHAQASAAVPRNASLLAVWLCSITGLGCPAAQVRPEPTECPTEVTDIMFKELKIRSGSPTMALIDVNQPGRIGERGLYQEGPVVGRITAGDGLLVEGTLLYGYLWTGPGLKDDVGKEAVIGRYTRALLPNGREYPVCMALGGPHGRMDRVPGSKPGTVELPRNAPVNAVWFWP